MLPSAAAATVAAARCAPPSAAAALLWRPPPPPRCRAAAAAASSAAPRRSGLRAAAGAARGAAAAAAAQRLSRRCACVSATAPLLKDKRKGQSGQGGGGREFRERKGPGRRQQSFADEDEEGGDDEEEDMVAKLVAASEEYDAQVEETLQGLQEELSVLVGMTAGGTASLDALVVQGKPLRHYASVSMKGPQAAVNVYHQQNVKIVKTALEETDASLKPVVQGQTTIMVDPPRMTREKREGMCQQGKKRFETFRNDAGAARRAVEVQHRDMMRRLTVAQQRQFTQDMTAAEKGFVKRAQDLLKEKQAAIMGG